MVIALRCHFVPRSTVYARTSRLRRRVTDCYYFSPQAFSTFDVIEMQEGKEKGKKGGKK